VLLVEDDTDSSDMLVTALTYHGATVTAALSASEGLEKLREVGPDILISDVGLPIEDGYDLIRKVRGLPAHEGGATPAIALTGYVSQQDRSTAISAGFQEHIPKPVDVDNLVDLIGRLASSHTKSLPRAGNHEN
jgi:CheY-like chemotaxis protein